MALVIPLFLAAIVLSPTYKKLSFNEDMITYLLIKGFALYFLLMLIFAIYKLIKPQHYFSCNNSGVYLGIKKVFIEWDKVQYIYPGELFIDKNSKLNSPDIYHKAVVITLKEDCFETKHRVLRKARSTAPNTFCFVSRKPEKTIAKILTYLTGDTSNYTPKDCDKIQRHT